MSHDHERLKALAELGDEEASQELQRLARRDGTMASTDVPLELRFDVETAEGLLGFLKAFCRRSGGDVDAVLISAAQCRDMARRGEAYATNRGTITATVETPTHAAHNPRQARAATLQWVRGRECKRRRR